VGTASPNLELKQKRPALPGLPASHVAIP
jgi:hypothetical protein